MSIEDRARVNRRDFLRFAGTGLGALAIPARWLTLLPAQLDWPAISPEDLPSQIQEILALVRRTWVDPAGSLVLFRPDGMPGGRLPLARTRWNLEHSQLWDRLYTSVPWGIVLHWFGDKEKHDLSLAGYLRGFDSLREVNGAATRTSAHFLVGDAVPDLALDFDSKSIGILQAQAPDTDGTPYVGSHLQPLDYFAHRSRRQYFVRALYQLGFDEPGVHSILQDWFDGGRVIDPNMRTIAIEITGYAFEEPENFPSPQKIANVVSVVWALMKRYNIRAVDLLGHHEVQLNKADPGKKFMALVRYLIGVKALLDHDEGMKHLVFENFVYADLDLGAAVQRYFRFTHDHLLLVSTPQRTYEWEIASGFWHTYDRLTNAGTGVPVARQIALPVAGEIASHGKLFTDPHNHEGIDLYRHLAKLKISSALVQPVSLIADGVCLFIGPTGGCSSGKIAIFRHRPLDGGEVLSVYGHLHEIGELQVGGNYPLGFRVGAIAGDTPRKEPFLHFAIAYGGTWKTDLSKHPRIPLNVGSTWINQRYAHPTEYLLNHSSVSDIRSTLHN